MARDFTQLTVWRLADELRTATFALARTPKFERDFDLRDEVRKTMSQICRNIPEGFRRGSHDEFAKFLEYSHSSLGELRSLFDDALKSGYVTAEQLQPARKLIYRLERALVSFMAYLRRTPTPPRKGVRRDVRRQPTPIRPADQRPKKVRQHRNRLAPGCRQRRIRTDKRERIRTDERSEYPHRRGETLGPAKAGPHCEGAFAPTSRKARSHRLAEAASAPTIDSAFAPTSEASIRTDEPKAHPHRRAKPSGRLKPAPTAKAHSHRRGEAAFAPTSDSAFAPTSDSAFAPTRRSRIRTDER